MHELLGPECCYTTHTNTYTFTSLAAPSHPWQIRASDIFTLDGMDYLILADFYSKVILVHNLPAGQSNSEKLFTSWKNAFVIMAHQKSYLQIMSHSMLVMPLQIAAMNGVSLMEPPVQTTQSPMDLQSHVSR